jgi:hypothetical protein
VYCNKVTVATEVLLSYCCRDHHDDCLFHCCMGKVVVIKDKPSFVSITLTPISPKSVPSIHYLCIHGYNPIVNGSSSLIKHFQAYAYINYFHCFGPWYSPSNFLYLLLGHTLCLFALSPQTTSNFLKLEMLRVNRMATDF